MICDANGVASLRESYKHLRRAGKLVVYGFHTTMPRKGGRPNGPKLALDWLRMRRFNPLELTNDSKSELAMTRRVPGMLPFGPRGRAAIPALFQAAGEPLRGTLTSAELASTLAPDWEVLVDKNSRG